MGGRHWSLRRALDVRHRQLKSDHPRGDDESVTGAANMSSYQSSDRVNPPALHIRPALHIGCRSGRFHLAGARSPGTVSGKSDYFSSRTPLCGLPLTLRMRPVFVSRFTFVPFGCLNSLRPFTAPRL
jgi:hypothetical protein